MRSALVLLASLMLHPTVLAQQFDYLVTNCRIIDGTGNPWFRADVY